MFYTGEVNADWLSPLHKNVLIFLVKIAPGVKFYCVINNVIFSETKKVQTIACLKVFNSTICHLSANGLVPILDHSILILRRNLNITSTKSQGFIQIKVSFQEKSFGF